MKKEYVVIAGMILFFAGIVAYIAIAGVGITPI
jgi:hypothetical protein